MAEVRVENVRIIELMILLSKLSIMCDAVDLIVNNDEKSLIVEPVIPSEGKLDTGLEGANKTN